MSHAAQPAVDVGARDPSKVFGNHVTPEASDDSIEVRRKVLGAHEHRRSLDQKRRQELEKAWLDLARPKHV
jgi:hypothetical protein